jgi:hypothetical protein
MDKLVAQYSRTHHHNEMYSEQEQEDFASSVPPLSLKFSLPPVDNVSTVGYCGGFSLAWMAALLTAYVRLDVNPSSAVIIASPETITSLHML